MGLRKKNKFDTVRGSIFISFSWDAHYGISVNYSRIFMFQDEKVKDMITIREYTLQSVTSSVEAVTSSIESVKSSGGIVASVDTSVTVPSDSL